jgi:hypothetical protein
MRNELELIEKIERYLKDQLSAAEKLAFEEQMAKDPALQEEVTLQQEIMTGVERVALRKKVQKASIRFKLGRNIIKWGLIGLGIIVLMFAALYFGKVSHHPLSYAGTSLPEYNEAGGKGWADADKNLAAQIFTLDVSGDTVIETREGMVLSVPANGFLDDNGQTVKGKMELIIKEAFDPATIIHAGLSSRSGDRLLETGGMFFVDARKDGKALRMDPARTIYAEIPTDTVKPGMQAFTGKRMPGGAIDWTNPVPLEHSLVPVDILSLDFYPPHYLDSLKKWGYNSGDKAFTDSLYYSFATLFQHAAPSKPLPANAVMVEQNKSDTSAAAIRPGPSDSALCGINPAKIKTIWSKDFQNTLLSTREFEQRIRRIHAYGDSRIFDLYVNNLDKKLCTIDSMAARELSGGWREQFLSFASRQDGNVKNEVRQLDKLREYYQKKTKAWTEAIAKTQNDFWNQQDTFDNLSKSKHLEHWKDSINRYEQNILEEIDLNLKEAWRQLGYDTTNRYRRMSTTVYTVAVTNTGWCNVDRFVIESVVAGTTLNFTDLQTGKKAIIRYQPVFFQVKGAIEYDRLYVYLLPEKLSSFIRLTSPSGNFSQKLNELMRYNLFCVAYKSEQAFFYSQENIQPKDYSTIVLTGIGKNELDKELNNMGNLTQTSDLKKENDFFKFEIKDQKRRNYNQGLRELKDMVMRAIFPCYSSAY